MDAAYRIRPASAADIASVASLERTMEHVPHWTVADYLAALDPAESPAAAPCTGRCFFVAEAGPRVAGFAVGRATATAAEVLAELESVAVAETFRRAGLGRALCQAVIAWARELGAQQIDLEVRSRSSGAIAFYNGLGFAVVGARPKYYRDPADDAALMRLTLQAGRAMESSV